MLIVFFQNSIISGSLNNNVLITQHLPVNVKLLKL